MDPEASAVRHAPAVEIHCSQCGFLGAFYVSPGQPLEEVRQKAKDFRDKHRCEFGTATLDPPDPAEKE